MNSTKQRPLAERFWEKVAQSGDCWEWTGVVNGGYGRIRRPRSEVRAFGGPQMLQAHRWAYEALVGEIPAGLQLDHLCRNQLCVNPYHLDPVPQIVNLHRGAGSAPINAAKTHCPSGHEYSTENTRIKTYPSGRISRGCKRCDAEQKAARRQAEAA